MLSVNFLCLTATHRKEIPEELVLKTPLVNIDDASGGPVLPEKLPVAIVPYIFIL